LFSEFVKDKIKKNNNSGKTEMDAINREILKQKQRISNAKSLMLDGEITSNDFKEMRIEIENKITQLTVELNKINAGIQNLDSKIEQVIELFSNLENAYQQKDVAIKKRIVSSIFPSKLIFDNKKVRTLKMNRVISLICSNDMALKEWKKRKHTEFVVLSRGVDPEGFEPSSKQGISELSTKFRTNLVFDSSQAFIQTKLKLRC